MDDDDQALDLTQRSALLLGYLLSHQQPKIDAIFFGCLMIHLPH